MLDLANDIPAQRLKTVGLRSATGACVRRYTSTRGFHYLPHEQPVIAPKWAKNGARVLVADENSNLRSFLTLLLALHYEVQALAEGLEARLLFRSKWAQVSSMLT